MTVPRPKSSRSDPQPGFPPARCPREGHVCASTQNRVVTASLPRRGLCSTRRASGCPARLPEDLARGLRGSSHSPVLPSARAPPPPPPGTRSSDASFGSPRCYDVPPCVPRPEPGSLAVTEKAAERVEGTAHQSPGVWEKLNWTNSGPTAQNAPQGAGRLGNSLLPPPTGSSGTRPLPHPHPL